MSEYKWIHTFREHPEELATELEQEGRRLEGLLGGKGANLMRMTAAGIPVPPGFTVTVDACNAYAADGRMPDGLEEELRCAVAELEGLTGTRFGDPGQPLLLSARSGSEVSMPGMMDSVLDLGLNDAVFAGLRALTRDDRFAFDTYRRLITMYSDVVMGVPRAKLDAVLGQLDYSDGMPARDIPVTRLTQVLGELHDLVRSEAGSPIPDDPWDQLLGAVEAVFRSADTPRAVAYREMQGLPQSMRTAANIQVMVFGNSGGRSGTGVAFSRNPVTGERVLYGEYLQNAQGEDVVAGLRTPMSLERLREVLPEIYAEFAEHARRLEKLRGDMQDIEFTVEDGKLWILQTRNGKRTIAAALRIAVEMVEERLVTSDRALLQIEPEQLDHLMHRQFEPQAAAAAKVLASGVAASPGAGVGRIVFTSNEAIASRAAAADEDQEAEPVILLRDETSPDDVAGMEASAGIVTSRGGTTCHAAIVGRQLGKPAVVGCEAIAIDADRRTAVIAGSRTAGSVGGASHASVDPVLSLLQGEAATEPGSASIVLHEGDFISVDGTRGLVMEGAVATEESEVLRVLRGELDSSNSQVYGHFKRLMGWADQARRLEIRANADRADGARMARTLGASGLGLVRTEHMFFLVERLPVFRELILEQRENRRVQLLEQLTRWQREDFESILREMDGLPVVVRLLDPPLHEFLPKQGDETADLAGRLGWSAAEVARAVADRREANPMLGHRGCRVGITNPEVYRMQTRALFEAACGLAREGLSPRPEVMIPLVATARELELCRREVEAAASQAMAETGVEVPYAVGTMIEVPRAALTAGELAVHAEFFSFGTNDLTQMTYGFSRDDVEGKFFEDYMSPSKHVFDRNPFETIDTEGVGHLLEIGTERGKAIDPELEIGVCGVHGGDPRSIRFFHALDLDYVSCAPFRVPGAILAAAQAAVRQRRNDGGRSD